MVNVIRERVRCETSLFFCAFLQSGNSKTIKNGYKYAKKRLVFTDIFACGVYMLYLCIVKQKKNKQPMKELKLELTKEQWNGAVDTIIKLLKSLPLDKPNHLEELFAYQQWMKTIIGKQAFGSMILEVQERLVQEYNKQFIKYGNN